MQANLNMHGVFLHVLGDALGSIGVLISGLCILLIPYDWKKYIDPSISIVICGIIAYGTIPLVRHASRILLQGVPENVNMTKLREDILKLDGVESVHELHVWLLVDSTSIASLHVLLNSSVKFSDVCRKIGAVMHKYKIHSSTVQPEFLEEEVRDIFSFFLSLVRSLAVMLFLFVLLQLVFPLPLCVVTFPVCVFDTTLLSFVLADHRLYLRVRRAVQRGGCLLPAGTLRQIEINRRDFRCEQGSAGAPRTGYRLSIGGRRTAECL